MEEGKAIDRFLDALNSHDLGQLDEVLAPDFVFEEVAGAGEASRAALRQELQMVFSAFPDITFRPVRRSREAARTYVEVRALGVHQGPFLGVEPTGAAATVSGVFNLQDEEGLIKRLRLTIDFGGLRRQLLLAAARASQ